MGANLTCRPRDLAHFAVMGAALGTVLAMFVILIWPKGEATGFLGSFGFRGWEWLAPFAIPLAAGTVAYVATDLAARRRLREIR